MAIVLGASLDNGLVAMSHQRPAVARSESVTSLSIGQYLIRRLSDYGIRHVFGLPGDYVLSFYSMLEHSPLDLVNCTREDCAGFAADAYARVNGMGAVCVTYGVGALSLANSIAGAYAEKSPVVLISVRQASVNGSTTRCCITACGNGGRSSTCSRRSALPAARSTIRPPPSATSTFFSTRPTARSGPSISNYPATS
jgi:hypothetical protein